MNAILVKDLRQSLHSRWFEIIFLWLIGSLCLLTLFALRFDALNWFNALFWLDVGLTLHLLLPLHCALSASEDQTPGNCELIRVTGLTAEMMVRQRLVALFCSALMVSLLVLPFVVLRYFLGSIELMDELQYLLLLTLGCPVLGGALLWIMTLPGLARFALCCVFTFLLIFYEGFTLGAAFSPGDQAVLPLMFWFICSFLGWIISIAFASESYLHSRRT